MKPGNEAGSLEFGFLRSALHPMKHIQVSSGSRRVHIDDTRRNLLPGREWVLWQVENLARPFPEREYAQHRFLAREGMGRATR